MQLKFECEDAIILNCNGQQISQVLINLINNAFDAVAQKDSPWIEVKVTNLASSVKVEVTDSGVPIDPSLQGKLFTPFFSTKDVGKGMGLGLSISNRIIAAHGGKIYYNPYSKTSSFVIELPATQSSSKAS